MALSPPPELVPDAYRAPIFARIPSDAATDSPGFETSDGAFVFRLHEIAPRPALAELVRTPMTAVPAEDKNRWDLAVETMLFGPDEITELPVAAREGFDATPAGGGVVASCVSRDGLTVDLSIEAPAPVPVLVKNAWHPNWSATDASGRELPVDRIGPGYCLVRAAGPVRLAWRRSPLELAAGAVSVAALFALGGLRRRTKQMKNPKSG